jgi:hypothetical protein
MDIARKVMTEAIADINAEANKNPYCQIRCRNCGRVTSRLQRVHATGTGWPYQLCWPCFKETFGGLPPFEWINCGSKQSVRSNGSAKKELPSPRGIKPAMMEKAIKGDQPFCLAGFFNDHLKYDPAYSILLQEVVDCYLEWADTTVSRVVPAIAFIQFMESKGCDRITMNGQVYFANLRFTCLSLKPRHRWEDETRALAERILKLTPEDLPPVPFESRQGERVIDSEKFLTSFQGEIRYGEDHPRSRTGALQEEMRILWGLLGSGRGSDGLENRTELHSTIRSV